MKSPKDITKIPDVVNPIAITCIMVGLAPWNNQLSNPTNIEFVPVIDTTAPAIPLSIPIKRNISAPAENAPPPNITSSERISILNWKNPRKAIIIQVTPKMNSAMKLIFINTIASSLLVQYREKMTLIPNSQVAMEDPAIMRGVTLPTPCPTEIMSTPPMLIRTPIV